MITISVPLTRTDRQQAQALKDQHSATEQAEQIYQNVLAVLATRRYLSMLDIPSDLEQRRIQDSDQTLATHVADLYLPDVKGHLECYAVRIDQNSCFIPKTAQTIDNQNDPIGYVVVRLNDSSTEATVLGFVSDVAAARLPLEELHSLDELIDAVLSADQSSEEEQDVIDQQIADNIDSLREMLNRAYQGATAYREWERPEQVLSTSKYRSMASSSNSTRSASWATLLKVKSVEDSIILIVQITAQTSEEAFDVRFIFCSTSELEPLPANLEITVSDLETGAIYHAQIKPEPNNFSLELPLLDCRLHERYKVQVNLDNVSITRTFEV